MLYCCQQKEGVVGRSLDDFRRAFFGQSDEELATLRNAAAAGITLASLLIGGGYPAAAATTVVNRSSVTADTFNRFERLADGKLQWGSGALATDVNLFRSAADVLKTDDTLHVGLNVLVRAGATEQLSFGNVGPASEAGILFGIAGDVNLFRSGANAIRTNDQLTCAGLISTSSIACQSSLGIDINLDFNAVNGNGYIQMIEQSADAAAPTANRVRFYCKDNGSGKSQLVARFNTGAVQVIATEP